MPFRESVLGSDPPASLGSFALPRREAYFPSPGDWRDQVLYFLLPDRFSDGQEATRPLLDRSNLPAARPASGGTPWRWDAWARSGAERWQGGTIRGIQGQLGYLEELGVTTIWIGPVFRQRGHEDSYHGYAIQDFLEVDPRFGTRADLVDLVGAAHQLGIRVILDIIFNHSGSNWVYPQGTPGGVFEPHYTRGRYAFGAWRGPDGTSIPQIQTRDDGVWPLELQDPEAYTRAGSGSLGAGDIDDPEAEHKRSDFLSLRDFRLGDSPVLSGLARCYKHWIALTDCDGFRIDTLKHVSLEEARNFCGTIKEFAANLGKHDFLLVGEIAGGNFEQDRYLDVLERNLNAALDIGDMRPVLAGVAKGLLDPRAYFGGFEHLDPGMGSHRNVGMRHVSILDDHDHVFGEKIRFSAEASSPHQVAAGVALQLFTLGIPCIYYGTEQGLGGPEPEERRWLPGWKNSDRYLREAMFGPQHPRRSGHAGATPGAAGFDPQLPGFGAFGTAGRHCFDRAHPAYLRIAALAAARARFPVLRGGRQYLRETRFLDRPFGHWGAGELLAWSRILDDEEALCVVNGHGREARGADVIVDANLSPPGSMLTVVASTAQAGAATAFIGTHPMGSRLTVQRASSGAAYVEVRGVGPSEAIVLVNHA